jgi:predicted PolB exonuclease-like 3'-5' exonuclease
MANVIYIDIETIPGQHGWVREEVARMVKPPATLKKAESIAAWEQNERAGAVEEAWLKTSFDGTYGQIVCISYAVDDHDTTGLVVTNLSAADEASLLDNFWSDMRDVHSGTSHMKPIIVGHNLAAFDLPFLWRRSVVNGIKPPLWWPRNPKPWSDAIYDTMLQWAGDRGQIGLDRLCRALGLAGKEGGPTGADVWPMAQAGKFSEIAEYCRSDVSRTRALHKRMTFATYT